MEQYKDLTGQVFGKLTVVSPAGHKQKHSRWLCLCECGNTKTFKTSQLTSWDYKSCGCYTKLWNVTHGESKTKLYKTWARMLDRVYGNTKDYGHYGGRGISVCANWLESYEAFRDWAYTNGYEEGLSIERINVNGNYEPSNCTWIPKNDQPKNRRNVLTIYGKTVQDMCREKGIYITCMIY